MILSALIIDLGHETFAVVENLLLVCGNVWLYPTSVYATGLDGSPDRNSVVTKWNEIYLFTVRSLRVCGLGAEHHRHKSSRKGW